MSSPEAPAGHAESGESPADPVVGATEVRALQLGLARGRLRAFFQPIVALASGRSVGVEALSRWIQDDGRPQVAARFLPAARRAGLFAQIDWLTAQDAIRASAAWRFDGVLATGHFTHLNLGKELLCQADFAERFLRTVMLAGADPRDLVVEIHEGLDLRALPMARHALHELADHGIALALDDFAAGHPALLTLGELDFSTIKTDRRLLCAARHGGRGRRLLEWTRRLADDLGASLVVEGVECDHDLNLAVDCGAHLAQGWKFASALSRRRIEPLLRARRVLAADDPCLCSGAAGQRSERSCTGVQAW